MSEVTYPSAAEAQELIARANDALEPFIQFMEANPQLEYVLVLAVKQQDKTEVSVSSAACCPDCALSILDDGMLILEEDNAQRHKHVILNN